MADENHLYIKLIPVAENVSDQSLSKDIHAIVSTKHISHLQILDYSIFDDYNDITSQFYDYCVGSNTELPFYALSHQISYNPQLISELNLSHTISGENFSWLIEAMAKDLSENSILNGSWQLDSFDNFYRFLYLFIGLHCSKVDTLDEVFSLPFFDTEVGRTIVALMSSLPLTQTPHLASSGFCNFYAGSWITTQYNKNFNILDDELAIIPYRLNNKIIYYLKQSTLQTYTSNNLSVSEKQRIWGFLKLIVSKRIQEFITNRTGTLSVRRDIHDYVWNSRKDFEYFIPRSGGIVVNGDIIKFPYLSVYSALFEQMAFFDGNIDEILKLCDKKFVPEDSVKFKTFNL